MHLQIWANFPDEPSWMVCSCAVVNNDVLADLDLVLVDDALADLVLLADLVVDDALDVLARSHPFQSPRLL